MVRSPLIVLAAFCATPASAQDFPTSDTGNGLLELCEKQDASVRAWYCLGFVKGIVDADNLQRWGGSETAYLCHMSGVTQGQMIDVIVKYLKEHPETRHHHGASLALYALKQAFCQQN